MTFDEALEEIASKSDEMRQLIEEAKQKAEAENENKRRSN